MIVCERKGDRVWGRVVVRAVSYTHLTLPTICSVETAEVAVTLINERVRGKGRAWLPPERGLEQKGARRRGRVERMRDVIASRGKGGRGAVHGGCG